MIAFKPSTCFAAAAMAALCATGPARADDAALYDAAPPADAVFIRVLAEHDTLASQITFAGTTIPVTAQDTDTYIAISAAQLSDIPAGAYYSLAAGENGPIVIPEPPRETATKVHLILLNTGNTPVRLTVPNRGLEVVAPLATGQAASRAVNPIQVVLAVERVRDGVILGTFDVSLSRGQNLTFVTDGASARLIENRFGPVRIVN